MRRMAGHRQHQVVVVRIHFLHLRPQSLPILRQLRHRICIGAIWGQKAPAIVKQLGKARGRPGMLGASQRVARHEMHARRNMRRHRFNHCAFHRPHIRHRSARFDMRCRLSHHSAHRPHRQAKHHQIRLTHRAGQIITDRIT